MKRLIFLLALCGCSSEEASAPAGSAGAGGSAGATGNPADYLDKSLREQVAALESGTITSAALTQAYLDRISERDGAIHAVIALDPDAVNRAGELDALRGQGKKLQGAVILVKDNIDTAGIATTAGSLAMANNVPATDAASVARVKSEHGVMLGKTNLSEWANFRGNQATSGWSSLGGQTNNGASPDKNPCGSSSGSAAAIAAGMASAALGTETDGSIVCPATVNGVVGFKPSVGLVSSAGVIPISHTQDAVGPITRSVGDAARMMSALAETDLGFEAALETATLAGKRLGVVGLNVQPPVQDLFTTERARIEAAGATTVDVFLDHTSYGGAEYTVLLHEFKVGLNAYLAAHPVAGQPTTLAELIAYNQANAAEVMPHFGQEVFTAAEATNGLDDPGYIAAKQNAALAAGANGIDAVMAAENLDALIAPTGDVAFETNYATGDAFGQFKLMSRPAAVAGYPHLTVPMGKVNGLPVGLSIFAGESQDAEVLALGHAYESLPE